MYLVIVMATMAAFSINIFCIIQIPKGVAVLRAICAEKKVSSSPCDNDRIFWILKSSFSYSFLSFVTLNVGNYFQLVSIIRAHAIISAIHPAPAPFSVPLNICRILIICSWIRWWLSIVTIFTLGCEVILGQLFTRQSIRSKLEKVPANASYEEDINEVIVDQPVPSIQDEGILVRNKTIPTTSTSNITTNNSHVMLVTNFEEDQEYNNL